MASTGISGVVHSLELFYNVFKAVLAFVHREFLWQVEIIGYFIGYSVCSYVVSRILSNFNYCYVNVNISCIFYVNLICSLRETLWFCSFCSFVAFQKEPLWIVWTRSTGWSVCLLICMSVWVPFLSVFRIGTSYQFDLEDSLCLSYCHWDFWMKYLILNFHLQLNWQLEYSLSLQRKSYFLFYLYKSNIQLRENISTKNIKIKWI